MSRHARFVAVAVATAVTVAACGIPEDNEPRAVPRPTATPELEAPTPTPTETTAFTIYLTDEEGRVRPAERQVAEPVTITGLIEELIDIPTEEEADQGLVSRIPPEAQLLRVLTTEERAIVDFAAGGLDTLEDDLILAVAQLVWTLTELETISQVVIRIEGIDEQWPTDGEDTRLLERLDYASFDPERVEPTPEPVEEDPPTEEDPPSEEDPPTEEDPTPPPEDG